MQQIIDEYGSLILSIIAASAVMTLFVLYTIHSNSGSSPIGVAEVILNQFLPSIWGKS